MMILTVIKKSKFISRATFVYGLLYLSLGVVQRERAESIGLKIAKARGHNPIRLESRPSFGNLLLWKTIYETENKFYVDAVRVGLRTKFYEGESIFKLKIKRDFPYLDPKSTQAKDIERFRFFSNNYIAKHPTSGEHIIDIRYSMIPNKITPMWGIKLTPYKSNQHTPFVIFPRDTKISSRILLNMLSED
jgi:inner membrane protein